MFKLLIVDDEEWIRSGIATTIPWERYGISVIGCAVDGRDAVSMIQLEQPDLVITDIVMPQMDGVQLAGWIQENRPQMKVIILSGYDEFSYAREAMHKGAYDYLLKPVEESALVDTVRQALGELEKERGKEKRAAQYEDSLISLKELFFMKLLDRRADLLELSGNEQEYIAVPLSEDVYYTSAVWTFAEKRRDMLDMFSRMIEGLTHQNLPEMMCDIMVLQRHIMVIVSSDTRDGVREGLEKAYSGSAGVALLTSEFGCCIGNSYEGIQGLKRGMLELSGIVTNTLYLTDGMVVLAENLSKEQMGYGSVCRACIDRFLDGVVMDEEEAALKKTEALIADIFQAAPRIGRTELGAVLYQAMSGCAAGFVKEEIDIVMPVTENNEAVSWVFRIEEREDAQSGMKSFVRWLFDNRSHGDHTTRNYLIKETLEYVRDHFQNDLSADDLADHLHISKVYFSQLFSRQMGSPFTKYLTSYRVDYAKKQLLESNSRIYEIAEQSGYNDVKYFLKVFKKLTGMSPQAYRERQSL